MKEVISELYHFFLKIMMWIPLHIVRKFVCKLVFNKYNFSTSIRRNIDLRSPYRIEVGNNCNINKNCVLDGRGGGNYRK